MKVLMINSVCGIRSTGRICTDLADILQEKGHECKIAYGRERVPEKYQSIAIRIGNEANVKFNALLSRVLDNEGFNARKQTFNFLMQIERYKPDIVHLHNLHGYYLNVELLINYLSERDIPVVWTMHDCWPITGHCPYFTSAKCEKWMSGCHHCVKKDEYPRSFFYDGSKKNWEKKNRIINQIKKMTIVTPSEWLASIIKKSFLSGYPVKSIPNGVDMEMFKPTNSNLRKKYHLEDKIIVLGVATSWVPRKGLQIMFQLQEELGNPFQVVLVGLTKEQLTRLPEQIIGIERTNSVVELAGIYTTSDVFVNASQQETMGLTTVEAMACGTPVVVSNLTAIPEVVDNNGGVIFDEYSAKAIAKKVQDVIANEYPNTRQNARKYEKRKQFTKYIELYESMIKGG